MYRRLIGAALALLITLTGLPLIAADPAAAHTQTVRRCAFDPFAGKQCWNETVSHAHRVIPDNPPPDTTPRDNDSDDGEDPDPEEPEPEEIEEPETDTTDPNGDDGNTGDDNSGDGDSGSGDDGNSGTRGTRSNRNTTTPAACPTLTGTHPHLDRTQHQHGTLGCHPDTPGHRHSDGSQDTSGSNYQGLTPQLNQIARWIEQGTTASLRAARDALNEIAEANGEAAVENGEITRQAGQEISAAIERLWNRMPAPAQAFIETLAKGAACAALVAVAAKTTVATAGTAAPAWLTFAASVKGQAIITPVCGALIDAVQTALNGGGDNRAAENESEPGSTPDTAPDPAPDTTPEQPPSSAPPCPPGWACIGPLPGFGGIAF